MARKATSRLKCNPPLGFRPSLENCRIPDLNIDPTYQRSIENAASQALIRKIATFWDWSLFHPLAVSRRPDGSLYVVDGQHRLAAAKLRRDMYDLPCVVTRFDAQADEAASFVAMNVQRRALNRIDLFKASVAASDGEAMAIVAAVKAAGLSLAPHTNFTAWKPGMISNIAGIEKTWRRYGGGRHQCGAEGAGRSAWQPGAALRRLDLSRYRRGLRAGNEGRTGVRPRALADVRRDDRRRGAG